MFPFIYNNTGITDDKVLHFLFSFFIVLILILLFNIFIKKENPFILPLYLFCSLFLISISKELLDSITPGRNVEFYDILANFVGGFFSYGFYKIYLLINKKKNN